MVPVSNFVSIRLEQFIASVPSMNNRENAYKHKANQAIALLT